MRKKSSTKLQNTLFFCDDRQRPSPIVGDMRIRFKRNNSPAGAERRARVLIPLGDLLHSGIVTEHSGIQSCANSMSSTLDDFVSYAHAQNLDEWRLVISYLLIG